MSKHTPGPWHVGGFEKATIYDKFGQRVGNTFEGVLAKQRSDTECQANATLAASAPELLDALKAAISQLEGHELNNGDVSAINSGYAAIAKATGAAT